jgi:hypothetical protein
MRPVIHTQPPRWPFWLLIAAWVCANSPQVATYALLTWMAEARSFTHQQYLTRDVAHLLAGEKTPSRTVALKQVSQEHESPGVPSSVPSAAVLKKVDLSSEKSSVVVFSAAILGTFERLSDWRCDALRDPPPHGPPRAA